MNLSLELILCGEVKTAHSIVDANNRGDTYRRLVTEQIHTLRVFLQTVQALLGAFKLCFLLDEFCRSRNTCGFVLSNASIHFGKTSVDSCLSSLQETTEVNIAASGVHHDVADFCFVGGCAVKQSQTSINR